MQPQVHPLAEIFELNTRLVRSCLEGVDDETARARLCARTNNLAFIALHLADARFYLAGYLGAVVDNPFAERFGNVRNIDEAGELPTVEELLDAWERVSAILRQCLANLSENDLAAESKQKFPLADATVLGGLTFLMQHDAYHVGQLAFLRKHFLGQAMSYD